MALLCNEYVYLDRLKRYIPVLQRDYDASQTTTFTPNKIPIPTDVISFTSIEGLKYISETGSAYKTLKRFGKEFDLSLGENGPVNQQMQIFYDDLLEPIKLVISSTLIGI